MQPVGNAIYSEAIVPLEAGQIAMMGALERSSSALRHFILKDRRDLPTILESLCQLAGEQVVGIAPILPCSTLARFHLRRLLEPFLPKIVVLPPLEIPPIGSSAVAGYGALSPD